jgi:hypothetical protein
MTTPIPAKPEAHSLAGDWTLTWADGSCAINLSAQAAPLPRYGAKAWNLTHAPTCAAIPALGLVHVWRPASDGIDLSDEEGRTRIFLSRVSAGAYEADLPSGRIRLTRD